MSLFPTKFVADVGTLTIASSDTLDATLTVDGTTILTERYSPANGQITVRGLRSVLEAAIYGTIDGQAMATPRSVSFQIGSSSYTATLHASRLRNPRDPQGQKTILAAGDLVVVAGADGSPVADMEYTTVNGISAIDGGATDGALIGDGGVNGGAAAVRLWVEHATCPDRWAAVRFLNRYDVPQTMMTPRPLEVKPAFQDQTALMYGQRVRYSVEQQDEYTLRSGRIHRPEEYASWADLVTSRRAEVWRYGQWLPIIVTKSNFTATQLTMGLQPVEVSFRMADPKQGL